jgi:hypothetical protein
VRLHATRCGWWEKKLVRTYNSSDFANLLAAGDVDLSQG